jgi:hypothetical protein
VKIFSPPGKTGIEEKGESDADQNKPARNTVWLNRIAPLLLTVLLTVSQTSCGVFQGSTREQDMIYRPVRGLRNTSRTPVFSRHEFGGKTSQCQGPAKWKI